MAKTYYSKEYLLGIGDYDRVGQEAFWYGARLGLYVTLAVCGSLELIALFVRSL